MKAVICPQVSSPASVAPLTLSPTYHMNCRLCTGGITLGLRQPRFMLQYKLHCKLCFPQRQGILTRAPVLQISSFSPNLSPSMASSGHHGLEFRSQGPASWNNWEQLLTQIMRGYFIYSAQEWKTLKLKLVDTK